MYKTGIIFRTALRLAVIAGIVFFLKDAVFAAGEGVPSHEGISETGRGLAFAAMGAVGISCIASSYALAKIGSAAMGAMSEKPEVGGRALIFLGMAEGIAIYGLIIAIMLVNKI